MDKETSEIAGLTERISKDPKSKLFVPLAEEYRKAGDIEMAIHVLLEGLKNNPGYVTARSSLGKFLLMNGDVAGAQKEFEEVVKAIPDNLMAQRKLGDIYISLNRAQDALVQYKTALSLNPKDEELSSLILEVEAGQDVSSKIQLPKAKTVAEQEVKQEPPPAMAAREPAPVSSPMPIIVEPVKPVEVPAVSQTESPVSSAEEATAPVSVPAQEPATPESIFPEASIHEPISPVDSAPLSQTESPSPFAEAALAPESSLMETEEAEEVLIVESLEPEASVQEPPASEVDLPEAEPEVVVVPSAIAEESVAFDLSEDYAVQEDFTVSEDILPDTELLTIEDTETFPLSVESEKTPSDEIVDAEVIPAVSEVALELAPELAPELVPELASETVSEASDDFATDTLAELYIAQGFFDKSIEIYERMLADKPNSKGLQDKLASVRAEAARAETPAAEDKKDLDSLMAQDVMADVPAADAGDDAEGPLVFDEWEESLLPQEVKTDDSEHDAVAEASEFVPTDEPEEIAVEAEIIAETGNLQQGVPSLEEAVFPGSAESKPAAAPDEQPAAAVDAGFDVALASQVKEQTRSKPQFTDFEPREYVPPGQEQPSLKPTAGKTPAVPIPSLPERKETIARLETWLTTIKKEK